jgi:hypothetical protein
MADDARVCRCLVFVGDVLGPSVTDVAAFALPGKVRLCEKQYWQSAFGIVFVHGTYSGEFGRSTHTSPQELILNWNLNLNWNWNWNWNWNFLHYTLHKHISVSCRV